MYRVSFGLKKSHFPFLIIKDSSYNTVFCWPQKPCQRRSACSSLSKFKKFRIKRVIFIIELMSIYIKVHTQKKNIFPLFFSLWFVKVFAHLNAFFEIRNFLIILKPLFVIDTTTGLQIILKGNKKYHVGVNFSTRVLEN